MCERCLNTCTPTWSLAMCEKTVELMRQRERPAARAASTPLSVSSETTTWGCVEWGRVVRVIGVLRLK